MLTEGDKRYLNSIIEYSKKYGVDFEIKDYHNLQDFAKMSFKDTNLVVSAGVFGNEKAIKSFVKEKDKASNIINKLDKEFNCSSRNKISDNYIKNVIDNEFSKDVANNVAFEIISQGLEQKGCWIR